MAVVMTDTLELRVYDRAPSGALLGLELLMRCLTRAAPASTSWRWRVLPGAWGHGTFVCGLEDRLNSGEIVIVTTTELLKHLGRRDEYFEDVRLEAEAADVRMAVVDSSFLQMVATRDVVDACRDRFERVDVIVDGIQAPET